MASNGNLTNRSRSATNTSKNDPESGPIPVSGRRSRTDSRPASTVKALLGDLEYEEKIFYTYNLVPLVKDRVASDDISNFLNDILEFGIDCVIDDFSDEVLKEFICYTLFKKYDEMLECWKRVEMPMFAGLLAVYILNRMRKRFRDENEDLMSEEYEELQEKMDLECENLLNECFMDDVRNTEKSLDVDYQQHVYRDKMRYHGESLKLMDLAYLGKAKNFLAHSCCQRDITKRWNTLTTSKKCNSFLMCLPPFHLCFSCSRNNYYNEEWCCLSGPISFFNSPNTKFFVHNFIHLLYILFYAYTLFNFTNSVGLNRGQNNINVFIIIVWQLLHLCFLVTELLLDPPSYFEHKGNHNVRTRLKWFKRMQKRFSFFFENRVADLCANCIIFVNILMIALQLLLPYNVAIWANLLGGMTFYMSFVLAVFRFMMVFNVNHFLGSIVLMIKKMVILMIGFIIVFIVFWGTYAVCHISLTGYDLTNSTVAQLIIRNGGFEIFGETDDEDKEGAVKGCDNDLNVTDFNDIQCYFKKTAVPVLLLSYMLITSIVLVNLLTALLTKKYDEISKHSHLYYKYKRFPMLVQYERRSIFPAPIRFWILWVLTLYAWLRSKCIEDYDVSPINDGSAECLMHIRNTWRNFQEPEDETDEVMKELREFVDKDKNNRTQAIREFLDEYREKTAAIGTLQLRETLRSSVLRAQFFMSASNASLPPIQFKPAQPLPSALQFPHPNPLQPHRQAPPIPSQKPSKPPVSPLAKIPPGSFPQRSRAQSGPSHPNVTERPRTSTDIRSFTPTFQRPPPAPLMYFDDMARIKKTKSVEFQLEPFAEAQSRTPRTPRLGSIMDLDSASREVLIDMGESVSVDDVEYTEEIVEYELEMPTITRMK